MLAENCHGVIEMNRLPAPLAIVLMCLSVSLSGCFDTGGIQPTLIGLKPIPMWMNVEVVSVTTTKKTIMDHVATAMTGQDCSTPRAERGDGPYCTNWPTPPAPPPELYCYSSLAKASCYTQPYTQANDRMLGYVPASIQAR